MKKAIGYYSSGLSGILIYNIENGMDDFVIWSNATTPNRHHRSKIRYENDNPNFCAYGQKIPMNEIMRVA